MNYYGTLNYNIVNAISYVYFSCDFFVLLASNSLFRYYFASLIKCCRKTSLEPAKNRTRKTDI